MACRAEGHGSRRTCAHDRRAGSSRRFVAQVRRADSTRRLGAHRGAPARCGRVHDGYDIRYEYCAAVRHLRLAGRGTRQI